MNGLLFPVKEAFGRYMKRWFDSLYVDTASIQEYVNRDFDKAVTAVPSRMIDAVEDILAAYQKNNTTGVPGANAKFPIVMVCMAKDYIPSGGETGARQVSRRLVTLSDAPGSSVYGYRQAMGDVRVQVVIMAAEPMSGQSLAAQFSHFIGEIRNRRFRVQHTFGQYSFETTCMLETPDILFSKADSGNQNMTILIADLNLKVTLPMLDAPKEGEDNDGSDNDPPGYPVVTQVTLKSGTSATERLIMEPVDRSDLQASLSAAAALEEVNYTPESWLVLDEAVQHGQEVYDNQEEPQRIVSSAAKAVTTAISELVPS